ncbi:MAG: RNA degradosome polyphosphate kinase [Propionibacteriaceae bacterium]|nr:RNA degradosome polyphosphate kinase [Propionibacteriaceae bacterium]
MMKEIMHMDAVPDEVTPAVPVRTTPDLPARPPQPVAVPQDDDAPLPVDRYGDRELGWLAFNNRVLDLAKDQARVPLLERARFMAIFSSNLDEFFMVRVAGLKRRIDAGVAVPSTNGMGPRELHAAILTRTHELVDDLQDVYFNQVAPELAANGIQVVDCADLDGDERERMNLLFADRIFPVLTPLTVDPSHPFPYISGLSLNIAVLLRNPSTGARQFARIKVPTILDRFIPIGGGRFVPLESVMIHHLDKVFTGMQILQHTTFRVTRNEDIEVEEDDAENLLYALETELLRRRTGRPPVRLEVEKDIDDEMLEMLVRQLNVTEREVFRLPAPLDLTALFSIADIDREDLKYPNFLPKTHPHLAEVETARSADVFAAMRKRDVLLHHPYDSFATSVQRLVEQAAADPKVLAIKLTLYRTSGDSPIVDALIEAAKAGKQVLAVVEIKARFDEEANIAWARKLEKYGVHVVYGMVGLKTHCKLILIVRDEAEGLRRYAHVGTGNYNPKTARLYEDMGLLTANPIITDDVSRLFNHLSGMSHESNYRRLMVAPAGVRVGLLESIEREIENHRAGLPARVRMKVNSIVDEAIIDALYRASQAGVQVQLWVRGTCTIRPGVPGLSDNIEIISILGRFLEHSRLYWFENAGKPAVGIGSADMMHRNLDRRVEVIVGITHAAHIAEIGDLFDIAFDPGTVTWRLHDLEWSPRTLDQDGRPLRDMQEYLINAMAGRRR